MEILVGRQSEEVFPSFAGDELESRKQKRSGALVLQAAAPLVREVDEEEVSLHRQAAEHLRFDFANFLQVGGQLGLVQLRFSPDDDLVRDVGGAELEGR